MTKINGTILFLFAFAIPNSFAETRYITDRILLGIHVEASELSTVVATAPSGTAVEVLGEEGDFIKVKLTDGTVGWVSSSYLKKEKPATAELDKVYSQLQSLQATNKKLAEDLTKSERELQTRRDQLSNANTTIKDLKKQLKASKANQTTVTPTTTETPEVETTSSIPEEITNKISALEQQVSELEQDKIALLEQSGDSNLAELDALRKENKQLSNRIQAAQTYLSGEIIATDSQIATLRPGLPFWYWLLIIAMFGLGGFAGITWFDHRHRQKHGGFRI